ncbi:platelet-activating factor acetylhydrolase IB subunit gamma-like [Acanthaster planci]|uniref:Platelet-activating factor acetylhydrolase IB subunit gamma-like n=1 Tax=Acanthaster planci TaxID=133434 RepID=A0A8B7Y2E6_ACAPL|nr:platelet-activating factor acetylhydrolase IB subunit gamma-like [Acanthaster planci]
MSSETNTAAVPTACEDVQGDKRWINMHERYVADAKEKEPEILFVGDSLIQLMAQFQVWTDLFEPLHSLNFGIGADQTQHVLWRLQNGALDFIEPKVIVLQVGTNNHGHTADETFEGIEAIIKYITTKIPAAQLIVMAIPPRGQYPNKLRDKIKSINNSLARLLGEQPPKFPKAEYFDANGDFVIEDGTICHSDMYDYLHLTDKGYRKICEPLKERLDELLQGK